MSQKREREDDKRDRINGAEIDRGVWLVKVPKYLAKAWAEAGPDAELGQLSIYEDAAKNSKIELDMSEELTHMKDTPKLPPQGPMIPGMKPNGLVALGKKVQERTSIPKKHHLQMSEVDQQFLAVMSENKITGDKKFKGNVVSRAEVRPIGSQQYMDLKKQTFLAASIPTRYAKQLDRAVVNFKPVNATQAVIENEARKKAEPQKVRDEEDRVQEMLFQAFEKHQYYNIKDLERLTHQPLSYLKEILRKICIYNMKAPHRNMYELKPQYRHYGASAGSSETTPAVAKKEEDDIMDSDDD